MTCGAGLCLWTLNDIVRRHGWALPVVNDGYAGPSAGGYEAAGGFGPGSRVHGGFWENVDGVTLLTPRGVRPVTRDQPLFPWLFGAMGQLGIVVELTLDLAAADTNESRTYPTGVVESPEFVGGCDAAASGPPPGDPGTRLCWFTLFVKASDRQDAESELRALERRHRGVFEHREPYVYEIRHAGRVVAPLIYPAAEDFLAVGSWGFATDDTSTCVARLRAFEADFTDVVQRRGYRRYVQSELAAGPEMFQRYFSPDVFQSFESWKRRLDSRALLNAGSVFRSARRDGPQ